jgi:hypothetical protein
MRYSQLHVLCNIPVDHESGEVDDTACSKSTQLKIALALDADTMEPDLIKHIVIMPHSRFAYGWDILMCFLLLYTSVVTVYEVAFIKANVEWEVRQWIQP